MQPTKQEIALSPIIAPSAYHSLDEEDSSSSKSHLDTVTQDTSMVLPYIAKRYFGNNKVFWFKNDEPRITLGPHWWLFIITWLIMIGAGVYCYHVVAAGSSDFIKICTVSIIIWQAFIYGLTALKNPGILTAKNPNDPNLVKSADSRDFCVKCKVLRDPSTVHCWECNVCIKGYDHHCPWTGKCIGKGNLYPFYAFLLSTSGYMVFFMFITFNRLPKA